MKIVVPISRADATRLDNWIECIQKYGGMDSHSIHFIPTHSMTTKAYEAAGKLGSVCKDVRVSPLDMDNEYGWPKAPNWHWYRTAIIMEELSVPWFWMELDCLPVRKGWASEIGSAYASSGSPFLGCIVPTPHKDPSGREVESPEGPEDKMMCGCGIYPSNMIARFRDVKQLGILEDFTKGAESIENPWDLHLRYVMRRIGMGHTSAIGDHWNTINYRIENSQLICDSKDNHEMGSSVTVRRAGVIDPSAVVIHGCKDDSLYRLIMGGLDTSTLQPLRPQAEPEKPKITPESNQEVEALKSQLARMEAMMAVLMASKSQPEDLVNIQPKYTKENPPPAEEQIEKLVAVIGKSKVRLRLAQLSGKTNISQNRIRDLADDPDCPFIIGPGGLAWVSLKSKLPTTTATLA